MNQQNEIWKPVAGYEEYYAVSDRGRIKALPKTSRIVNRYGHETLVSYPEKLLRPSLTPVGYYRITLCVNNNRHTISIHRLVMTAFKANPGKLPQINHINGIKTDNSIANLEWCDQFHNQQHAYETGLNIPASGWKDSQSKPVKAVFADNSIHIYGSIGEASKNIGIKRELVSKSCRESRAIMLGKYKGYKFSFL